jgi:hypothetical protein
MPPRTIVVNPLTPSNSLSFQLESGVSLDVESVLAAIDTSAAGDTTALLTVADSSGAVIARKAQTEKVTGGVTGSATWALRLADDPAPAAAADVVLLWEFTVSALTQALVRTDVDGPMAGLFPQTFKSLEAFSLTHGDTISAGRTDILVRFNNDAGAHYSVMTSELAGNPPAAANGYAVTNGVLYCGAGQVNGVRPASMTMWLPGYSNTRLQKAGHLIAASFVDDAVHPPVGILQTIGFGWHPVAVAGINRLQFATVGPAGITEFAEGSYFAVYGRR